MLSRLILNGMGQGAVIRVLIGVGNCRLWMRRKGGTAQIC